MTASSRPDMADERVRLLRRLASISYDLLLVLAMLMVLTGLVFLIRGGAAFEPSEPWFRAILLAGWWGYFAGSWVRGGQTVGMRAWRLTIQRRDGARVGLGLASLRFAAAALSSLALGLGFLWSLIDRDRLAWHDRLSGTALVFQPKLTKPEHSAERNQQ